MRGYFITFEGIEGCGKSTLASAVSGRFREAGLPCLLTREPGGNVVSERIRRILLDPERTEIFPRTELLLYLASRAQLVAEVIGPALAGGTHVLCDRFMDASTVYQGWARGIGEEKVEEMNSFAVGDSLPDRTFVLDLDVEEGFRRGPARRESAGERKRDRLEREDRAFHEKVREGYLRLARRHPERVITVDASMPIEEVASEVMRNIAKLPGLNI